MFLGDEKFARSKVARERKTRASREKSDRDSCPRNYHYCFTFFTIPCYFARAASLFYILYTYTPVYIYTYLNTVTSRVRAESSTAIQSIINQADELYQDGTCAERNRKGFFPPTVSAIGNWQGDCIEGMDGTGAKRHWKEVTSRRRVVRYIQRSRFPRRNFASLTTVFVATMSKYLEEM